jgi:lipoprotein NlpI
MRLLLSSVAVTLAAVVVGQGLAQETAAQMLRRASEFAAEGKSAEAVSELSRAIELEPGSAPAYYLRGRENFRLGKIDASVADFEKLVALAPQREKSLWELGISYYYAGKFEKGAKQFELYQTYHDSDVENAAWRYLCMAPTAGMEKAREKLLPISNDPRVPLMEIYALYQGKATPDEVFAAAQRGNPSPEAQQTRLFYAHLYVGLFHEAAGDRERAKPHLAKAAGEYRIDHYMGDVARVHHERLSAEQRK